MNTWIDLEKIDRRIKKVERVTTALLLIITLAFGIYLYEKYYNQPEIKKPAAETAGRA